MYLGTDIALEAAIERKKVIVEIEEEENSDNDSNIDNNGDGECFDVITYVTGRSILHWLM